MWSRSGAGGEAASGREGVGESFDTGCADPARTGRDSLLVARLYDERKARECERSALLASGRGTIDGYLDYLVCFVREITPVMLIDRIERRLPWLRVLFQREGFQVCEREQQHTTTTT